MRMRTEWNDMVLTLTLIDSKYQCENPRMCHVALRGISMITEYILYYAFQFESVVAALHVHVEKLRH